MQANAYSGDTTISGGTLLVDNPDALAGSTLNYSGYGGSLAFAVTIATLGGLEGTQNLPLTTSGNAPVAVTVGGNDATTVYSGNLTGGAGLTKVGMGTLTLTGSYPDSPTVTAGTLIVGPAQLAPNLAVSGDAEVDEGDAYSLNLSSSVSGVSWEINWGDDTAVDTITNPQSPLTHYYGHGTLSHQITVTASEGTSTAIATLPVTVDNVPPTLTLVPDQLCLTGRR